MVSLYKLARKLLPAALQARLGNRHKVKRQLVDAWLFRFTAHPAEVKLFHESSKTVMPEALLEGNPHIPAPVAAAYRQWYNHQQSQYVTRVDAPFWIEPYTGWPMGDRNQLYLSLYPAGRSPYMATPGVRTLMSRTPVVELENVISLRDVNERGYSHFYSDIMAKLALIERQGIRLADYTLVLSKALAATAYGSFLIEHSPLFKAVGGIFLQGDEYVRAQRGLFAYACINPSHNPENFRQVIAQAQAALPNEETVAHRRIFLTRAPHRRRAIRNIAEIEQCMRGYGFEIVDADQLTLPQQIVLFRQCRHLVGIHGAGLVNMLYRAPHPLSVFELREPVRPRLGLNAQYHNTAFALGAEYGATLGEDTDPATMSFYLSPARLAADFERFWQQVCEK